jgi:hypothetical protein
MEVEEKEEEEGGKYGGRRRWLHSESLCHTVQHPLPSVRLPLHSG